MKFLVVGLGSMGKRRVRNLLANGIAAGDIAGFDVRQDRADDARDKYGIATTVEFTDALMAEADAVVISTAPDLHYGYAGKAARLGKHFFVEAGVHSEGIPELMRTVAENGITGYPSCTMRFFPGPRRIKELVSGGAIGPVYCWQYQSGQYLPDWHPWESIHDFYVSKRETGACREIVPFELTWLTDVFGSVSAVDGMRDHLSDIDADIEDVYLLQMRHEGNTLGQLIVDVVARAPVRAIRILGRDGNIEWSDAEKRLRVFDAARKAWREEDLGSGSVEQGYINPEEPYINEIGSFLHCIRTGEAPPYTFEDYLRTAEVLYRAETSADSGQRR